MTDKPVWRQGYDVVERNDVLMLAHFVDDTWARMNAIGLAAEVGGPQVSSRQGSPG